MADDLMAQLEAEYGEPEEDAPADLMAELERTAAAPKPSRTERIEKTFADTRDENNSWRTRARKVSPIIAGGALTALEEMGALFGSEALYEAGSGEDFLSPDEIAALPADKQKDAERRQMPGLKSAALEVRDFAKVVPQLPALAAKDPGGFVLDMGTGMVEGAIKTDARGGPRREEPVSSSLDILGIKGGVGAVSKVPAIGKRALQVGKPAVGRAMEKTGKGFGRRANEIEAAEEVAKGNRLGAEATDAKRAIDALPETSKAKKLKLELDRAKRAVDAIDAEYRADPKFIHTNEAKQAANLETRLFDAVKNMRRLEPEVQAATRKAWDARKGLGDFRMKMEQLLPPEQLNLIRTLNDDALKTVFDNKHTPAVERARGGMKGAERKAASSEVAGGATARGYLARLQKARRVEAQKAKEYAAAREAAETSKLGALQQHVDLDAAAKGQKAKAGGMSREVKDLPDSSTASWLRRIARANPGEKNILDEAAVGIGGGGLKGAAAGIIGKVAGDWTNDAAAMQRVASTLIKKGRSMQQADEWADVIGPALKEGGAAGGIQAVRGLLESGRMSPEAAADLTDLLMDSGTSREEDDPTVAVLGR